MYRVSRIYIANAGYRLAWYPGLLLPFTDVETNLPTQAIYNLANQGGKTTFLSLFFSVFDTKQDRFLQTLSNPGQHFVDYFDKDGLPGIIAVEWDMPSGDLLTQRKRFVTGQLVCLRKSGDGLSPERHFFLFEANDRVSLEAIPGPNLPGAAAGALRTREDCMRWLHDTGQANRGNFQYFTNQTEWKAALNSYGFDVELLQKQVDFNRKEGAMDEAFLDFKSELDFVRRFLMLTLNQEKANDTQQLVASLCRKMANRKQLQDALAQMERLGNVFHPFAKAASEYQAALAARDGAEQELGIAVKTLDAHLLQKAKQIDEQSHLQRTKESEHTEQSALAWAAEADAEALEAERLSRIRSHTQKVAKDAEIHHLEQQRQVSLVGAAKLNGDILGLQAEIAGLDKALAAANEGTAPLRKKLGENSALYRRMLIDLAKAGRYEAAQLRKSAEQFEEQRKQQESLRTVAQARKQAALERQTQARTRLSDAAERRQALIKDELLGDDEQVAEAIERFTAEKEAVASAIARLEQEASALDAKASHLLKDAVALEKEHQPVRQEQARLAKELSDGESLRETLVHNRALAKAAGAETCDPDSEVLPVRTAELQRQEDERRRNADLHLSRLKEGQESLDLTDLFGRDPDVARVVRLLSDLGVVGVRAYAEYLAYTVPNPEQARNLVLSNPGRYLGVAVPTTEALDKSKALLAKAELDLGRPIVISTYSTTADRIEGSTFVIGPPDDSLWNKQAAAKRATLLATQIDTATKGRDDAQKIANETLLAKNGLDRYLNQFGDGKLDLLRTKVNDLAEQLAAAELRITEMRQQAAEASEAARKTREEAAPLQKHKMPRVSAGLQTLRTYFNDWEVKCLDWEKQLAEAAQTFAEQEAAEDRAKTAADKARDDAQNAVKQAKSHEDEAQAHDQRRNGLALADEHYDAEAALKANPRTLPEIEAEYNTTHTALRAAESEKTEPLVVEHDIKSKQLKEKREEYGTRYPADRFPPVEVRALIGNDYRMLEKTAQDREKEAQQQYLESREKAASATTTFELHQQHRKHPNRTVPNIAAYSDEDISSHIALRHSDNQAAVKLAQAAKDAAVSARNKVKELKDNVRLYEGLRAPLVGLSLDFSTALADVSRFADVGTVTDEVTQLIKAHAESKKVAETSEKRARQAYEAVTQIAADDAFSKTDYEIATMLRENPLESTAADAGRIEAAIRNRIDALTHDLSKMDEDFARATSALMELVGDASRILRRAVESLKLPDNVPIVGNKSVFKMRTAVLTMSQEQKKQVLSAYMEELTADRNIPETGAQLAAQALMRLADNKLGLKLLKMVEIEDEQYVAVDRLSHSGAEKISMALFLYFVTMRLRYEQRATVQRAESGVLVLDNPFAKATLRPIWEAIHSLAEAMGLQLIIATGMNEHETLSVFKRHLRLSKTQMDKVTGRIHVKVTDYQFFPMPDKAAA